MSSSSWRDSPQQSYPKRSDKILWREADDCVVLFHEDDGRAFGLNEIGSAIWKLSDGSRSIEQICRCFQSFRFFRGISFPCYMVVVKNKCIDCRRKTVLIVRQR